MEVVLTLGLVVVWIMLMRQRKGMRQFERQLSHEKLDLEFGVRSVDNVKAQVLELGRQVELLQRRLDALATSATPAAAPIASDLSPVSTAMPTRGEVPPVTAQSRSVRPEVPPARAVGESARPEVPSARAVSESASPEAPPVTAARESAEPEATPATSAREAQNADTATAPKAQAPSDERVREGAGASSDASLPINAPPSSLLPKFDWESLIGVRLFSWIAGLSLLLGAIFFLRYSADHGWLSPTIRMAFGFIVGIAILIVCEWKGRNYRVTANAMDAAGIGTLFATSFAANAVWHVVPMTVSFLLLILVTTLAVLLSLRRNSLFIALLGLVGGFATPVLLSTGENHPFGLFSYLLLLNVGLGFVGYRRRWPILLGLSMGLTTLYQWGWFAKFVSNAPSQLPIAVGVFLLFPVVWVLMNRSWLRLKQEAVPEWASEAIYWGSAMPLLLAVIMAWVPAFGQRYLLMFGYLLVLDLGLLALDHAQLKDRLAKVASAATLIVWIVWLLQSYQSAAWPVVNAVLFVFVAVFLGAQVLRARVSLPPSLSRFAAPGLLLASAILAFNEPACASPFLLFGVLLVLLGAVTAVAVWHQDGWLYYAAVPIAILAQACWSAKWLNEGRLLAGLLVYLTFALFFVAVPLLARRLSRVLGPPGLTTVIAPLNLALLLFLAVGPVAGRSLWMIGLLLAILNVGAFIEAYNNHQHRAALASIGLSWVLIVTWWANAMTPERLLSGLVVVLALVLLTVGGMLWLRSRRTERAPDKLMDQGPLLGLVGHLFLLFASVQPQLNSPPWTILAITLVLDLALIVASLYLGRALFAVIALALTHLLVGLWALAAIYESAVIPNAEIALLAMLGVVALGLLLPVLARRRGLEEAGFRRGRDIIVLLGQALLIEFASVSNPPHWFALLIAQLIVMSVVLVVAGVRGQHRLALAAWAIACATEASWGVAQLSSKTWAHLLALAALPYALLTVYPVFCHRLRTGQRWPFVLALCGALAFFGEAYAALKQSPLSGTMGALPLVQALITAGLLVYLLKVVERAAPRDVGRLALVAAVALGFATTAIPLQLENEWLTIAWALEAAAVAWLYQRLRHTGLIAASLALAAAITVRLVANPEVFLYHVRSSTPLLNFYLYTYLVSALALYLASWYLAKASEVRFAFLNKTSTLQRVFGTLLLFVLVNVEIADFYSEGNAITFRFSSTLAQDLTYTLAWATFAIGMLLVGIGLKGRAARIAALLLLTVTIAKCFLHDLWRLGGLYRVGSFVGLALCLALVAILLQRFVLKTAASENKS